MKHTGYFTRALKAKDRRYARVFDRMGYERSDLRADDPLDHDGDGRKGGSPKPEQTDDLAALREQYLAVIGKRPFMGWDADTLREKIAAAKAG